MLKYCPRTGTSVALNMERSDGNLYKATIVRRSLSSQPKATAPAVPASANITKNAPVQSSRTAQVAASQAQNMPMISPRQVRAKGVPLHVRLLMPSTTQARVNTTSGKSSRRAAASSSHRQRRRSPRYRKDRFGRGAEEAPHTVMCDMTDSLSSR